MAVLHRWFRDSKLGNSIGIICECWHDRTQCCPAEGVLQSDISPTMDRFAKRGASHATSVCVWTFHEHHGLEYNNTHYKPINAREADRQNYIPSYLLPQLQQSSFRAGGQRQGCLAHHRNPLAPSQLQHSSSTACAISL